jgi:cell division protein FtsA
MSEKIIVAIDLGSSRLVAAAAQKDDNQKITIVDLCEKTTPKNCIRRGVVCNIEKIADEIVLLLKKLQTSVANKLNDSNIVIKSFYYAVNGHTLRSESFSKNIAIKSIITANTLKEIEKQIITELQSENIFQELQTSEGLFDAAQFEDFEKISILHRLISNGFNLDGNDFDNVINKRGDILKVNYLGIRSKSALEEKLKKIFEKTKNFSAQKEIALLALAETFLSDEEKNNNCLLIDFGANCTSCIAFEKGKLRDLFVIPFGSQNITKDISTLYSVSEEKSEVLKINLSLTTNETWKNKTEESTISRKQIENVAMGRLMEIIQLIEGRIGNLELNGGIVLAGGGSKLRCFADLLQTKTSAKVRNISFEKFTETEYSKPENALIFALLNCGKQNCCEQKEGKTKDTQRKGKGIKGLGETIINIFND